MYLKELSKHELKIITCILKYKPFTDTIPSISAIHRLINQLPFTETESCILSAIKCKEPNVKREKVIILYIKKKGKR